MIRDTGVVIDSAAYLPQWLVDRYGVIVVPLSVEIDGEEYLEGVDITPEEFYSRLDSARSVSTSQPSIGRLMEAYGQAAEGGANQIVSVHISSTLSGTVQAAQLAAESSGVPVTVVDSGQGSFAEGLCVWEALEALEDGADVSEAAERVGGASAAMGNTFVVKALDLVKRSGRMVGEADTGAPGVPVMAYTGEGVAVVGMAKTTEEAVGAMAGHVEASAREHPGRRLRVGVGHGGAPEMARALRERIEELAAVEEIVDYVVGPAIGAHTGVGTAGAVFVPRRVVT